MPTVKIYDDLPLACPIGESSPTRSVPATCYYEVPEEAVKIISRRVAWDTFRLIREEIPRLLKSDYNSIETVLLMLGHLERTKAK